jgi:thymidylate kinase
MKKPRSTKYVCLEGLDGSGKSTTIRTVSSMLESKGIYFDMCNPTQRIPIANDRIENIFSCCILFQKSSLWRAFVYARRAKWAARNTDWSRPLILGDRSIVTSYVTRWRKWLDCPFFTIWLVDILESTIPAPDVVFYLDAPHDLLMKRLELRGREKDIDETLTRSLIMRNAYQEIIEGPCRPHRLAHTKFVRIQVVCEKSPDDIASEIVDTIVAELNCYANRGI